MDIFYILQFLFHAMKKEVTAAANKLLEILYLHDIDQAALNDLDLPHKYVALSKLIQENLVEELGVDLPSGDDYSYYNLTPSGEKQHEEGGFRPRASVSVISVTLIMVAATVIIVGVATGLVYLIRK